MPPVLYIVHCVDTEGPLEETVSATFERLRDSKGIDLEPSPATLRRLQNKEIDLQGREEEIADFVSPERMAYLSTWTEIEEMVDAVTCEAFRKKYADPSGNPYTFSWFIIDVVGYRDNPRRKAVGYHVIWDQYARFLDTRLCNDSLGWHIHTVPVGNHALEYNTCWTNNDYHERVLARRLIERRWFPSLFRAGAAIERNDLSFWLEQFIPFDYSCDSQEQDAGAPGRLWDWRFAPVRWGAYHPDFYDYRKQGQMKRRIFRCLDVDTTVSSLTIDEVRKAFRQVSDGQSTVMAYSGHDRRDIRVDVEKACGLIHTVASEFPNVQWTFTNAHEAARRVCNIETEPPPVFDIAIEDGLVYISSDRPLFGVQPFLAVHEDGDVFYRDNPTIESATSWAYRPVRLQKTRHIGVAGANRFGEVGLNVIELSGS